MDLYSLKAVCVDDVI